MDLNPKLREGNRLMIIYAQFDQDRCKFRFRGRLSLSEVESPV